jgi:fatty-acyl-CoA synthase
MAANADTLVARLARAARVGGNAPAASLEAQTGPIGLRFLAQDESARYLRYPELHRRATALAWALVERGIEKGDRVALILPTSEDFPIAFFGVLYAGAIPVPLYPPLRLGRLDEYHSRTAVMLRRVRAKLVLSDRRIQRILGRTLAAAKLALGCLQVAELERRAGSTATKLPAIEPSLPAIEPSLPAIEPDDTAFIQFSSGTVGDPKPICLSHRQVLANATRILDRLLSAYPEDGERVHAGACWLPLYHDMGLVGCLLVAVAHPGELTLIPPELFVAQPAIWLRAISRYRATISPAPNFAYALCVERVRDEQLAGVDLSSLCAALNGAEPVTASVLQRFVDRFTRYGLRKEALTPVYGLAEATLAVTFAPIDQPFITRRFDKGALLDEGRAEPQQSAAESLELTSVGKPLSDFELRIVGEDGAALGRGQLGRIWTRGPSVMQGYDDHEHATREALVDGWLDTGDEGFLDERGELYIYGRAKDIIIINGRNIAPQQIEHAIDAIDGVRTGCSAAVGIIEPGGEQLYVIVEHDRSRKDLDALESDISRHISKTLGLRAQRVVVVEPGSLPRTSSGKIRRNETKKRYLKKALDAPQKVTPLLLARELIRSRLASR